MNTTQWIIYGALTLLYLGLLQVYVGRLNKKKRLLERETLQLRAVLAAMDSPLNTSESSQVRNLPPRTKLFATRSRQATARHLERQR